ncbi:DUF3649 domain-containing protein [Herbaspirillum autotrophicum]|uniref:DUF3649 domain-containing protein n=1 Tax=Herbaspirillum autotrophicum TaxID=180195 RepID=UPI00067BB98C|nr:DUF3649 domain-containing protein [Herbaspirillum autotrophicum]
MKPGTAIGYRFAVASRALAAILGGYALTAVAIALLALWLPMARAEAVLTATLLSFALYAGAVIWVFAARSAWRAWFGILLPALGLGLLLLITRSMA